MWFAQIAHSIANIPFIKRQLTTNRLFVRLYFNWRYRNADPYGLDSSDYEREKFDRVTRALGFKPRFESVLEIGCGEGKLTARLAPKADRILAVDISDLAIGRARKSLRGMDHVVIERRDIFSDAPSDTYELVVCSEVLFYFEPDQLPGVVEKVKERVRPGGYCLLVHARALADDTAGIELKKFGARTIHEMFINDGRFITVTDDIQPLYRVTIVQRLP